MRDRGNAVVNAQYEAHLSETNVRKPSEQDTAYLVENFIRDKYEKKLWAKRDSSRRQSRVTVEEKKKKPKRITRTVVVESSDSESSEEERRKSTRKSKSTPAPPSAASEATPAKKKKSKRLPQSSDSETETAAETESPVKAKRKDKKSKPKPDALDAFETSFDALAVSPAPAKSGDFTADFAAFAPASTNSNHPPKKISIAPAAAGFDAFFEDSAAPSAPTATSNATDPFAQRSSLTQPTSAPKKSTQSIMDLFASAPQPSMQPAQNNMMAFGVSSTVPAQPAYMNQPLFAPQQQFNPQQQQQQFNPQMQQQQFAMQQRMMPMMPHNQIMQPMPNQIMYGGMMPAHPQQHPQMQAYGMQQPNGYGMQMPMQMPQQFGQQMQQQPFGMQLAQQQPQQNAAAFPDFQVQKQPNPTVQAPQAADPFAMFSQFGGGTSSNSTASTQQSNKQPSNSFF